jgi:hypothetical protein
MVVAIQEGAGEAMGTTDQEFVDSMNEDNGTDDMVNAEVSEYNEDGYIGTRITFTDEPLESFSGVDGSLVREGDNFVFTGNAVEDTEGLPAESGAIATMSITFPGKVGENNGTVKGNTVTWDLLTQAEAPYATGSAIGGGGGLSPIVFIIVGILLAAVIVGVILLVRRNGGTSPMDEAPPAVEINS